MKLKKAYKIIFFSFALICSISAPFSVYAYDWSASSSPVDANDFYYNYHSAQIRDAFFVIQNNDMRVNASSVNSSVWLWNDGANNITRVNNTANFTGLFRNENVTMTPGYRYICSVTLQVRRDFNDLTNSFKGFNSDFFLYSSSYPGNYSRYISPSDTKLTTSDRLQAIYEFDFNPESMFSDFDSNSVDGFGFKVMFNEWPSNSAAAISSVRLVLGNFKCIVLSPEDYETLKTVEGITKMDVETFERISSKFEYEENVKQDALDQVMDLLPDTDNFDFQYFNLMDYAGSVIYVGEWMQEFYNEIDFVRVLVVSTFSISLFFLIARITHV